MVPADGAGGRERARAADCARPAAPVEHPNRRRPPPRPSSAMEGETGRATRSRGAVARVRRRRWAGAARAHRGRDDPQGRRRRTGARPALRWRCTTVRGGGPRRAARDRARAGADRVRQPRRRRDVRAGARGVAPGARPIPAGAGRGRRPARGPCASSATSRTATARSAHRSSDGPSDRWGPIPPCAAHRATAELVRCPRCAWASGRTGAVGGARERGPRLRRRGRLPATGAPVFRWVDDVVVVGDDRRSAVEAASAFSPSLRALGLEPNPMKTRVVDGPASILLAASAASAANGTVCGMA